MSLPDDPRKRRAFYAMRDMMLYAIVDDPDEALQQQTRAVVECIEAFAVDCRDYVPYGRWALALCLINQMAATGLWFRDYHEYTRHVAGMSVGDVYRAASKLQHAAGGGVSAEGALRLAAEDPALAPLDVVTVDEWKRAYLERVHRSHDLSGARFTAYMTGEK